MGHFRKAIESAEIEFDVYNGSILERSYKVWVAGESQRWDIDNFSGKEKLRTTLLFHDGKFTNVAPHQKKITSEIRVISSVDNYPGWIQSGGFDISLLGVLPCFLDSYSSLTFEDYFLRSDLRLKSIVNDTIDGVPCREIHYLGHNDFLLKFWISKEIGALLQYKASDNKDYEDWFTSKVKDFSGVVFPVEINVKQKSTRGTMEQRIVVNKARFNGKKPPENLFLLSAVEIKTGASFRDENRTRLVWDGSRLIGDPVFSPENGLAIESNKSRWFLPLVGSVALLAIGSFLIVKFGKTKK